MKSLVLKCFRGILTVTLCVTMLFSFCFTSSADAVYSTLPGDVDGDGKVNLNDLITLAQYVANWTDIDYNPYALDVNGDGEVTLQDVTGFSKYLLGWEEEKEPSVTYFEKFDLLFEHTEKFIYRVGNANAVSLNSLFEARDDVDIQNSNVTVNVETIDSKMDATATYLADTTDWTKGTLKFSGTGIVNVTITDNACCTPTTLQLEVVDAVNATGATSAKSNNVVLLNDVGFSTLEVSGGYTLYGNGFKMEAINDVMYDTMRAGFVTLENGTLDNVQIICPNFSYSIIYNNQIHNSENTATPSDTSNDARGNVRSAIMADGNSKIVNSYVHGGRAAIFLRSGNLVVDGSTVSGGAAANIHAISAQSLTLRNATLFQKPFVANVNDTSKTVMGFSGLFECDESGNSTPLILEGTLTQDAWINEDYQKYVPSEASSIVDTALKKGDYIHDLNGDGINESLNLGFTYIPQDLGGTTAANVTDNRINKTEIPYSVVDVGNIIASAKVYSYTNTNGTNAEFTNVAAYLPTAQGPTVPTLTFADANENCVLETAFDEADSRWESTLTVNLDNGNYTFNFSNLLAKKHGSNLNYTATANGEPVDTSNSITLTNAGVTDYVLTITNGEFTHTAYFTLTATKTSIPEPVVTDTTGGTPLLVVKSKNSDWSCAIPALEGIKVKYWDNSRNCETILDLATLTPTSKGKQNGTNNYWETNKDGYKLKVSCGVIHDTKSVYGMPVVVDNNGTMQMYFTITSTNGYVSTGTSSRAVTLTYNFTDPNGKSLTFTKAYTVNYADYKSVAQYSYSDFVNGKMNDLLSSSSSGGGNCVTPDTLITLADGTQKRVDSLNGNEMLLVWNLETGKYEAAPIVFIDSDSKMEYEIIHLYFSNGSDVKVITEHGFFDVNLGKYVYIDATNYADYIGHTFVTEGDITSNSFNTATLEKVVIEKEVTTAWSPVTFKHLCYYTNGVLSMPGGIDGLFNIFEVDTNTMCYDAEQMQKDIETYGLFTLEDFGGLVPEVAFEAFNGNYLKIAIAKGMLTWEDIAYLAERYVPLV